MSGDGGGDRQLQARPRWRSWWLLGPGLAALVLLLWQLAAPGPAQRPAQRMRLALPTQMSAGAVYVGQEEGAFAAHGIALTVRPFVTGKIALDAVLRDEADLAIVADTPFALAVLRGSPVAVVSSIYASRKMMSLMADRSKIGAPADLAGKTIGTVFGTNAQYFLDTMMLAHGVPRASVTIVDVPPEQLEQALLSGRVDAVTIWHPQRALLRSALGAEATSLSGEDIFVYRFLLVAKTGYIERNGAAIARLLAALDQAIVSIQRDPARARQVIARSIGLAPDLLQDGFSASDFHLALDQSLLLELGVQSRWALRQGIVAETALPDFLDHLRPAPLQAVRPSAVKYIR